MNRAGHSSSLSSRSCGGYFLDVVNMGARCPHGVRGKGTKKSYRAPKLHYLSLPRRGRQKAARAQSQLKVKECSAVGATGVRVDLRARKGSSTLLSPGDGATYRRDGENILQTYLKKASSSCTIPSIEKTTLHTHGPTSTPQPRNEDRQELGDYTLPHSRHERHRGGT